MHNTIRSLLIICVFYSLNANSQSFSSSPYSRFGIGDLSGNHYAPGIAMGGTGIALRSNHFVNTNNPASYTEFDTLSFIFDIGVTGRFETFSTNELTLKSNNVDLTYFSTGFPVTRWWDASIGLMPYSNVGYNIADNIYIDSLYLQNTYRGNGGISQVYVGNGFRLFSWTDTLKKAKNEKTLTFLNSKNISFGVNSSYYFGSLERRSASVFPEEAYIFDMYTSNKTIINDFGFKFGMQYIYNRQEIKGTERTNKYSFIAGLTFDNENNLNAKNTSLVTKYLNLGGKVTIDTVENKVNQKGDITFPMNLGFGLAFISKDQLTLAFDYKWQQWSAARFFGVNDSLIDTHSFAFGLQIVPEPYRHNKYFKSVNYRLGAHYTQSYLNIRNQKINDIGISFGLGLPIRKPDKSEFTGIRRKLPPMINFAVEIGQRGTLKEDLIKENYIQFSFNLSLYDIWFVKRRFN